MAPLGRDHFWPEDHNLNKLGRGPLLHTKYKSSMPCGFRQEDFLCFPYISLCITCHVTPGTGPFMAHGYNGHNLNKLGSDPLDDATSQFQISMPCGFR